MGEESYLAKEEGYALTSLFKRMEKEGAKSPMPMIMVSSHLNKGGGPGLHKRGQRKKRGEETSLPERRSTFAF